MGEPKTMILPPRSAQNRASSPRYSAVLRRTAASATGQVKALGLGQQPVQPDDFQAGLLGQPPHFGAAFGRDVGDVLGDRERRDLDAR